MYSTGNVTEELWMDFCDTVQETVTKTILPKKKFKKAVCRGLTNC